MANKKLNVDGKVLMYSSTIFCTPSVLNESTECVEIYIGSDSRKIPLATKNMQTDSTDFEGITFAIWSKLPNCKVCLRFDQLIWNRQFPIDYDHYDERLKVLDENNKKRKQEGKELSTDTPNSRIRHYMRFLYRVMNMKNLYTNFIVHSDDVEEIDSFTKLFRDSLEKGELLLNVPNSSSGIKGKNNSIEENHLEKWFVMNSGCDYISNTCGSISLHDQFPCGLFYGKQLDDISKKRQIFNTGYFDLWGINDSGFHIFELKKEGNKKLGIISELFCYSCLLNDFIRIAKTEFKDGITSEQDLRGFGEFVEGSKKDNTSVTAYFLTPGNYPFFEGEMDKLIKLMNERNDNVKYKHISFSQKNIVGDDVEAFISKLNKQWKECNK